MPRRKKTALEKQQAKEIGDRIIRARTRYRLNSDFVPMSRKALSKAANISMTALGGYERGKITPGADVLKRLTEALHISIEWLLYGKK